MQKKSSSTQVFFNQSFRENVVYKSVFLHSAFAKNFVVLPYAIKIIQVSKRKQKVVTVPASVCLNKVQPVERGIGDGCYRGKAMPIVVLKAFWVPWVLMTDTV